MRFGESTPRREDDRLIAGRGRFADDFVHAGALVAAFVRSPHACARIVSIDAAAALAHPGVVAVLTAAELEADGVSPNAGSAAMQNFDGSTSVHTPRPLLAGELARYVGEPVAMVLAEDAAAALDASELVVVDYDAQPAVADVRAAAAPGAPLVWPDRPGNLAYHWRQGDVPRLEAALAASHHVTRLRSVVSRVYAAPMEPRSAVAWPDEAGRTVLRLAHQAPHQMRDALAASFGLKSAELRVICGDVGGSFGMKSAALREEMLVFWAARRTGRAVRWTASRSESFVCDDHARDVQVEAELGLDAQGRFTALRVRYDINIGAFMSGRSGVAVMNMGGIAGVYTTPVIVGEALAHFTHTQITSAYRGAGRPDATYAIERLIDLAAFETAIDPAELRRRNLIPASAMPYRTPFVFEYDCGDFERVLDRALALADYAGFPARREAARLRGRLRGIGLANPIEVASGPFANPMTDWANVQAHADGTVTLVSGNFSVGTGLETSLSTVVAAHLGIAPERVHYLQGDTDAIAKGKGSGGSSGFAVGGTAAVHGVQDLLDKARALGAQELEVAPEDLEYAEGVFRVRGSDIAISLGDIARTAELTGIGEFKPRATFPNGCHVCEVEIDPQTGQVEVIAYTCVEDLGRVLNPMLVEGQVQGGVAQGIGQALMEWVHHDTEGQLLSGSFMDYAMPRAADIPAVRQDHLGTLTAHNPLGVKGVGEAGTVGGLSATMNAVCNALQAEGVPHLDMPATPSRVWQALQDAKQAR